MRAFNTVSEPKFRRVSSTSGREGEAADDQRIVEVRSLTRRALHQIVADGIVFRADADGGALRLAALHIAALERHEAEL